MEMLHNRCYQDVTKRASNELHDVTLSHYTYDMETMEILEFQPEHMSDEHVTQ